MQTISTLTQTIKTPLGFFSIKADEEAILSCDFNLHEKPSTTSSPLLNEAAKQCHAYFEGRLTTFDLPLAPVGTAFQMSCWNILQTIPFGHTLSYSEQAMKMNNPKATRAVGGANGRNPIPLLIPCHRVIGKNGDLTGFSGGLKIKQFLLQHEKELTL